MQKQNGELTDRVKELEEKLKKETAQRIYNFNKSIEWKEKHRELEAQINRAFDVLAFKKKRIAELEAQIEKMKCCENCRYCNEWGEANSNSPNCKKCNWVSNWKLRR